MMIKPSGPGSPVHAGPPSPSQVPCRAAQTVLAAAPRQDLPVQHLLCAGQQRGTSPRAPFGTSAGCTWGGRSGGGLLWLQMERARSLEQRRWYTAIEHPSMGSQSILVHPLVCTTRRRSGLILTSPPRFFTSPQISTSAPSTGPATTSASTPLGVSSASATRATRCMGSLTVEVGPAGGWQ